MSGPASEVERERSRIAREFTRLVREWWNVDNRPPLKSEMLEAIDKVCMRPRKG